MVANFAIKNVTNVVRIFAPPLPPTSFLTSDRDEPNPHFSSASCTPAYGHQYRPSSAEPSTALRLGICLIGSATSLISQREYIVDFDSQIPVFSTSALHDSSLSGTACPKTSSLPRHWQHFGDNCRSLSAGHHFVLVLSREWTLKFCFYVSYFT